MFEEPPPASDGRCGEGDVNVLFVVDRSGSMNCNLPPITESAACEQMASRADPLNPSKWDVIVETLSGALGELVPKDGALNVRVGLSYFSTNDRCGARSDPTVPVADANQPQMDLIRTNLMQQTPAGATPIVGSTILAYKHLHEQLPFEGEGHVIVVTDGADSCQADYDAMLGAGDHITRLIDVEAPKARGVGIRTWVIGAPGSEPARSMLSRLALSGGTARSQECDPGSEPTSGDCHYDMTTGDFQEALSVALSEIAGKVTCQVF